MRRRDFMMLAAGAAAALPLRAHAQTTQRPVIGFLNSASPGGFAHLLEAFRQSLNEAGFAEGRNVSIEYRWAEGRYERLPALADDLVHRNVSVIAATGGIVSAQAARAATTTIPILFVSGSDPVQIGLVPSLNRPGGNITGVSVHTSELVAKRLELLRDLVPSISTVAMLVNPDAFTASMDTKDMEDAARASGLRPLVLNVRAASEFEAAFARAVEERAGGILVTADPFFNNARNLLVVLAQRHALPAAYPWREYVDAGGLMSYGPRITDAYRQVAVYAARILNGTRPGDLPVQLPTTFSLVINLGAAKALNMTVPRIMLARADEVIE